MTDSSRLSSFYADDLRTQREQVARRAVRRPRAQTTGVRWKFWEDREGVGPR